MLSSTRSPNWKLSPISLLFKGYQGALCQKVNWPGSDANHSPPSKGQD